MAQTYQMKHNPQGTIYSLLTVESDGRMTMTFHGTDREISHEATLTEDGRITTGGSLFPGLESGKWNKMEDVVETNTNDTNNTNNHVEPEVIEETTNCTNCTNNHVEPEVIEETTNCTDGTFERPRQSGKRLTPRGKKITTTDYTDDTDNEPFARPEGTLVNARTVNHQPSSTMKAVGMVAAATVALFVIYETGLLIPLGLIGLATGGILK